MHLQLVLVKSDFKDKKYLSKTIVTTLLEKCIHNFFDFEMKNEEV